MQTKRNQSVYEMMLLPPLDSFIPKDHYLRRLDKVLNLDFIHELVADRYCQDNGRPSIDPEVVIRLFLLQAIEGITHVRALMRQVHVNLAYRWFIGYSLEEKLPDHSTLSKALDRFGDDVFNALFERSIKQCQASGLIEGKVLHVDATTIRADIDKERVNKPDSSDPDARYGKFPGKRKEPGYKQHTVADGRSRVIVGLSVTPANDSEHNEAVAVIDSALDRLARPPEAVCADSAYSSGDNGKAMEERGIRLVSPPGAIGDSQYFTIEQFTYLEEEDVFICPGGKRLVKVGRYASKKQRWKYRASIRDCRSCSLKSKCTKSSQRCLNVTSNHASLVRLRADSKTESFKQLYRSRAPVIEGIFAEAKQWHGLRRAWRRGLSKMRVQSFLIAAVLNFKRLAAVFYAIYAPHISLKMVIAAILAFIERCWSKVTNICPIMPLKIKIVC